MIPAWQTKHLNPGDFNGLGLIGTEYHTPVGVWDDTYDADWDGEGYIGSCVCPHCRDVANHYVGAYNRSVYMCGSCGHHS